MESIESILDKHIQQFYKENPMCTFCDIPKSVFVNAMIEFGKSEVARVRKVGSLQPLTIDNVNKMLKRVATDTWIAAKGTDKGFKDWYAERCKLNLNSNVAIRNVVGM